LNGLTSSARHALDIAAVAGRRFEFSLLQDVLGVDEESLLPIVKELMAAQLVIEESADRFSFRHALTRQAIYLHLLVRERRNIHRQIAESLRRSSSGSSDSHVHDMALHYSEAGDWQESLRFSRLAGERALSMDSPRIALEHFDRAVTAAESLGLAPDAHLLRLRARAADTVGDVECARVDYETALELSRARRDVETEWRTLLDLGLLWASRDYVTSGQYLQEALALARERQDPIAIARSLNRVGNWRLNVGDPTGARLEHEEALVTFERLDDRQEIANTLDLLGLAVAHSGNVYLAIEHYRHSADLCRELGDRLGLITSLSMLSQFGAADNRIYPAAIEPEIDPVATGREAVALAREIGWRSGEAFALLSLSFATGMATLLGESLASARQSLAISEEIDHRPWACSGHGAIGMTFAYLGAFSKAHRHLDRALALANETGSAFFMGHTSAMHGWTLLLEGDLDRAEYVARTARLSTTSPYPFVEILMDRLSAAIDLARGDGARARATANRLIAHDASLHDSTAGPSSLLFLRGQAERLLGRDGDAEQSLVAARDNARDRAGLSLRAEIDLALGSLYRALGKSKESEAAYEAARSDADQMLAAASDSPDDEIGGRSVREQLKQVFDKRLPNVKAPTPLQASKQAFDGLTAREREVAALVATGMSNKAIADELHVGERTVITHVTNILAKLDYSSRSEIAVWAVDKGLATPRRPVDPGSLEIS
jgi:DNA-binding CsgD family transcriptional regulator